MSQNDDFYKQAQLVGEVIRRILSVRGEFHYVRDPQITLKPIVEFRRRMRVSGLEKFSEGKIYFSSINFYVTKDDLVQNKTIGVLILYMTEQSMGRLFNRLDYVRNLDEDDVEQCLDACGTLCNLIAGNFRTALTQLDFREPQMSHFSNYVNSAVDGIEYYPEQPNVYEINVRVDAGLYLIADLNMGPLPKTWQVRY